MNIDIKDNNRKSDILEYRKIVDVLGVEKSPISLAEFQDLKYNDVERYKELKDRVVWSEAKFPSEKSLNEHFEKHAKEFVQKIVRDMKPMNFFINKPIYLNFIKINRYI